MYRAQLMRVLVRYGVALRPQIVQHAVFVKVMSVLKRQRSLQRMIRMGSSVPYDLSGHVHVVIRLLLKFVLLLKFPLLIRKKLINRTVLLRLGVHYFCHVSILVQPADVDLTLCRHVNYRLLVLFDNVFCLFVHDDLIRILCQ